MLRKKPFYLNVIAAFLAGGIWVANPPQVRGDGKYVTAGKVLNELKSNELVWYVGGIVEGLAYARFRKDTMAATKKVTTGSDCIRKWFHGNDQIVLKISATFKKYADYTPWVVIAAMVKKECGE